MKKRTVKKLSLIARFSSLPPDTVITWRTLTSSTWSPLVKLSPAAPSDPNLASGCIKVPEREPPPEGRGWIHRGLRGNRHCFVASSYPHTCTTQVYPSKHLLVSITGVTDHVMFAVFDGHGGEFTARHTSPPPPLPIKIALLIFFCPQVRGL